MTQAVASRMIIKNWEIICLSSDEVTNVDTCLLESVRHNELNSVYLQREYLDYPFFLVATDFTGNEL